jgi:hypothetical protein
MDGRSLFAGLAGGAVMVLGPALVRALTDNPSEQIALSLMIAGPVIIGLMTGFKAS